MFKDEWSNICEEESYFSSSCSSGIRIGYSWRKKKYENWKRKIIVSLSVVLSVQSKSASPQVNRLILDSHTSITEYWCPMTVVSFCDDFFLLVQYYTNFYRPTFLFVLLTFLLLFLHWQWKKPSSSSLWQKNLGAIAVPPLITSCKRVYYFSTVTIINCSYVQVKKAQKRLPTILLLWNDVERGFRLF